MRPHSHHSGLTSVSTSHTLESYSGAGVDEHYQPEQFIKRHQPEDDQDDDVSSVTSSKMRKAITGMSRLKDKRYLIEKTERRGLFAQLSIIPEFKDARDYPPSVKKMIVFIIAFSSVMGPMGTSIIFPAINPITKSFKTTTIMVNVSVGVYSISLGIFPIWWSSFSEMHGRRTVYIISFMLLFAFCIGASLSPNISAFTVLRMLCGAASASVQSVGAGTVADLYIPEERGKNLGIYYMGALMAPLLSPIIAAGLVTRWSWRSTQWFMVILSGFNVLLLVFLLPETLRRQENRAAITAILLERRNKSSMKETEDNKESSNSCSIAEPEVIENDDKNGVKPVVTADFNYEDLEAGNATKCENLQDSSDNDEQDIRRILTGTSSIHNYPDMSNNIDVGAPQMSRIQSHDPKLEMKIRERDLRRMRTNLEDEIARIETEKSGTTMKGNHGEQEGKSRWQNSLHLCYVYFIRPMKSLYFLKYPPVLLAIIFSAISFAVLYFVNMTIEYDYSRPPYNFKPLFVGLMYIPNSVTYIFASIYGGKWVDRLLKDYKKKYGIMAPEARISWNMVTAVVTFPISLIIFGWCLGKGCHWVTPLVGTALFGYASMMTIGATVSYLVDSLPGRGATGVALNNLIRQLLAAVAVFVTEPMLKGMGTGWAFTMLAFIIIGSSSVLLVLKKHGDHWRENYDLQKLYDMVE